MYLSIQNVLWSNRKGEILWWGVKLDPFNTRNLSAHLLSTPHVELSSAISVKSLGDYVQPSNVPTKELIAMVLH